MTTTTTGPRRESEILNAILREFGTRRDMRVWRMNTGVAKRGPQVVRFGVPGQADITGILPDGRRLEIEVKSNSGRQTEEQQNYQAMIQKYNGVYICARSVDDIYQQLAAHGYALA